MSLPSKASLPLEGSMPSDGTLLPQGTPQHESLSREEALPRSRTPSREQTSAAETPHSEGCVPELSFAYDDFYVSKRKFEIVKIVAKHAVLNPSALVGRETEFDFLRKDHELYPLYRSFVKQYELIKAGSPLPGGNVLKRAIERAQLPASSHEMANLAGAPAVAEATAQIDWQDFIVLETVEFLSGDLNGSSKLSAPFTSNEMRLLRDQPAAAEPVFQSAITGELVPESEYNQHIRAHQIDPSYYAQKAQEQKRSVSNLDYDHVAENLRRLRQKRAKADE